MLSKDRCKTTSGFFVIPLLSQLWEEKIHGERRNELSSWRPVVLPNRHIHLCLFKLGHDVHALLSSVMYILSGENTTAVYTISQHRWDQNTTQVANGWTGLHTYDCSILLHVQDTLARRRGGWGGQYFGRRETLDCPLTVIISLRSRLSFCLLCQETTRPIAKCVMTRALELPCVILHDLLPGFFVKSFLGPWIGSDLIIWTSALHVTVELEPNEQYSFKENILQWTIDSLLSSV